MLKSLLTAVSAVALFSTLSYAAPFATPATSSSFPLLSGTYVASLHKLCQTTLNVTYKEGVNNITMTPGNDNLSAATVKFTQGSKGGSGSVTITETNVSGSVVLIKQGGTATSETLGNKLSVSTGSDTETFSQTATTFSLNDNKGTSTYKIYYGKVTSGIAQHAAFAGIDDEGCAEQGTITII